MSYAEFDRDDVKFAVSQATEHLQAEIARLKAEGCCCHDKLLKHTCKPPLGNPTREEAIEATMRLAADVATPRTLIAEIREKFVPAMFVQTIADSARDLANPEPVE